MSELPRIMCVIGTRSEALKMLPVIEELEQSGKYDIRVILSAQHRELLDQIMKDFNVTVSADFDVMTHNQTLPALTAKILDKFDQYCKDNAPDMIIAQGDTTTTMVSALMAFYNKVPFAHIEAGLRSHDPYSPYPEEMNRVITSKMTTIHFAPTNSSRENLNNEGINDNIFVVGNTIIDTLKRYESKNIEKQSGNGRRTILVTCHRRENFGDRFENICNAMLEIVNKFDDVDIIYPVHPNPNVQKIAHQFLGKHERISLVSPLDYRDLISTMQQCYLVLTDSGGLQEEAPALGKPVLVMRVETERPEGIEAGVAKLVGVDQKVIVDTVSELLTNSDKYQSMQKQGGSPFGDGLSSERIKEVIDNYFDKSKTDIKPSSEFNFKP